MYVETDDGQARSQPHLWGGQGNILGVANNKFGGNCLRYYAYRKMMSLAVKNGVC